MVGVVVAAHGDVAGSLVKAAEGIVGKLEHVVAVPLDASAAPDDMRHLVEDAVRKVDGGDGVLVLCDMFGGTPSNVCLSCTTGLAVEVVTGVNLPMVIKAATARDSAEGLADAAAQITQYGQRNIAHASQLLRDRQRRMAAPISGATAEPAR